MSEERLCGLALLYIHDMDVSRDKRFSSAGNHRIGHLTVKQNLLVSSSS